MENGCYIPLTQVVLAIGTLVTAVVAVTVEDNQTLSLSLSGSSNVVSLLNRLKAPVPLE